VCVTPEQRRCRRRSSKATANADADADATYAARATAAAAHVTVSSVSEVSFKDSDFLGFGLGAPPPSPSAAASERDSRAAPSHFAAAAFNALQPVGSLTVSGGGPFRRQAAAPSAPYSAERPDTLDLEGIDDCFVSGLTTREISAVLGLF